VSQPTAQDRSKIRVSLASVKAQSVAVRRLLPAILIGTLVAFASACGQDRLARANDAVSVVSGEPSVSSGLPGVDRGDGGSDGGANFGSAAPYQVDSFQQQAVQKVDILWVIDNSSSMDLKQTRVKANFQSFIQFLVQQQIDFHLGVVTTDIYDPKQSGKLVNAARLSHPWISATDANPVVAFQQNASVGTSGSGDEKPLLAGMLALTAPLSPASPSSSAANCAAEADGGVDCFLRPNAPLYTIVLSDEEDSSCSPINASSEGCNDAAASQSGYGNIDYWSRFYSGAVGTNTQSRLAAIVANENTVNDCAAVFAHDCDQFNIASNCGSANPQCATTPGHPCCIALNACYTDIQQKAQWCAANFKLVTNASKQTIAPYYTLSGSWPGCVSHNSSGGIDFTAFAADRTAAVAAATGGVATSICQQDYTPALASLGLQAAGLRTDFPISRAPVSGSILVTVNGVAQAAGASTWQYVRCNGTTPLNVIRFASPPAAGAKVVSSYYVNVRGLGTCP
jgi:hypothetical protein